MKQTPNLNSSSVIPVYGANATSYRTPPTDQQRENGVIPLDSLPADWWNWLWYNTTSNLGEAQMDFNSLYSEIISVLTAAGISPSESSTEELRDAIISLARTIADTTYPGAVKSGTAAGQLNVNGTTGIGTINCLGNPTSLETTSATIVGAINEVNTALETLTNTTIPGLANTYAPLDHSSTNTAYGIATETKFGHIRVCNGNGLCLQDGVLSMSASQQSSCIGLNVTGNAQYYPLVFGQSGLCTCADSCLYVSSALNTYYDACSCVLCTRNSSIACLLCVGASPGIWVEAPSGEIHICTRAYYSGSTLVGRHDFLSACIDNSALALGYNAQHNGANYSTVIGANACTSSSGVSVLGYKACTTGNRGTSVGFCTVSGPYGTTIGSSAYTVAYGTAIGTHACSACTYGIAIGYTSTVCRPDGVAIGNCNLSLSYTYMGVTATLDTVGNTFSFAIDTGTCATRMRWSHLVTLMCCIWYPLWVKKGGNTSVRPRIYWSGHCNGSIISYCCTNALNSHMDGVSYIGQFNFACSPSVARYLDTYWLNCWRSLCCTDTGSAAWVDACNRCLMITGNFYVF